MFTSTGMLPNSDVVYSASMELIIDTNPYATDYFIDWCVADDNGDIVDVVLPTINIFKHIAIPSVTIPKPSNPIENITILPNDWDEFDINPILVSDKQIDPTSMVTDKIKLVVNDLPINHTILFVINHK